MAAKAARNWRATHDVLACEMGRTVVSARRVTADVAAFNVVRFEGGGYVVTAADTQVRPIVFFSGDEDLQVDPRNPLFALLKRDLEVSARIAADAATNAVALASVGPGAAPATSANEAAWAALLADPDPRAVALAEVTPSDIRVGPLVASKWNQGAVRDKKVFNFCTPNSYVCGCVATATAQIMRYFEWPKCDVEIEPVTNPHCWVDGVETALTTQGGCYNWDDMPLVPDDSLTETQQQAIGKLCSDLGILMAMDYAETGSGTMTICAGWVLQNVFHYSNAVMAMWNKTTNKTASSEQTRLALLTNFDAHLPVEIGITEKTGEYGHALVADGYGYSNGTLCYHLNYGWSGSYDGWYCPPDVGYGYTIIDELVYNIFTNQTATCAIVSGRVLDADGNAVFGAQVEALKSTTVAATGTTDAKGIFALYVPQTSTSAQSWTIRVTQGTSTLKKTAKTYPIRSVPAATEKETATGKTILSGGCYRKNFDATVCNAHLGDVSLADLRPAARIGSTPYYTFAAACAAVQAGETVTLAVDATETVTVVRPCTLDFNGFTLTGTLYVQNESGTVTLRNGKITGASDSIDGKPGEDDVYPNGSVRFEDMTVTGTVWSNSHPLVFAGGIYLDAVRSGSTVCMIESGSFAKLLKEGEPAFAISGGQFAADFSSISTLPDGFWYWSCDGTGDYPWTVRDALQLTTSSVPLAYVAKRLGLDSDGQTAFIGWLSANRSTISSTAILTSQYVKTSYLLGRTNLLTEADAPALAEVKILPNGTIAFDFTLGDEKVIAQALTNFVEISTDLVTWRPPDCVTVDAQGRVTVTTAGQKDAFVRIRLTQDP